MTAADDIYRTPWVELRLGNYRDVLASVVPDTIICDPPYSDRTVNGQRSGSPRDATGWKDPAEGAIAYRPWARDDVAALVDFALASRGWFVMFGDHYMMRWAEEASPGNWFPYAPVPWVKTNAAPRMNGDGPSPQAESIFIARRRTRLPLRFRPGWYSSRQDNTGIVIGAKPLDLMRRIVCDYSEPGQSVVDCCAGGATTLIAAALSGRRAIGAEMDPKTFALAVARLRKHEAQIEWAQRNVGTIAATSDGQQRDIFEAPGLAE